MKKSIKYFFHFRYDLTKQSYAYLIYFYHNYLSLIEKIVTYHTGAPRACNYFPDTRDVRYVVRLFYEYLACA